MAALEFAGEPGVDNATRSCSAGKATLQVRVLGSFAVLRHQTKLPLPRSKKTRALLAYLAVTARAHSRDSSLLGLQDGVIRFALARTGFAEVDGALARCLRFVLLFRGDVHAPEALRVDRFLHHAGLFCFVDECRE